MKSITLEIYPNKTQVAVINRTMAACRWVWNKFIALNKATYKSGQGYISAYTYSNTLTELKKYDLEYQWLNKVSQKAVMGALRDADQAYRRFFKNPNEYHHPKFKGKKNPVTSYFFVKNQIKLIPEVPNRIILPVLGSVRITHKEQLPDISLITGGKIIKRNEKYYALFHYNDPTDYVDLKKEIETTPGIGIDLGTDKYLVAYVRNTNTFIEISSFINNVEEYPNYLFTDKDINHLQQIISKKAENNYKRKYDDYVKSHNGQEPPESHMNKMKSESFISSGIRKVVKKLRRKYQKRTNIADDFINKLVNRIILSNPRYITIENLNVRRLTSNNSTSTLHDHILKCKFGTFKRKLVDKCHDYDIEIREAGEFFPSTKLCSKCGAKKVYVSVYDRIYKCNACGTRMDRDHNAARNLCYLNEYVVL